MHKPILALAALAASSVAAMAGDLGLRAAYGPAQAEQSPWSRPYIGLFGGVGAGDFAYATEPAAIEAVFSGGGVEAGVRAGYDYAAENFLVGAVADLSLTTIRAASEVTLGGLWTGDIEARLSMLGTIRGRLGVPQRNNLYYLHGGAAVGWVDITVDGDAIPGVIDHPRLGFVVGAGFEHAISEHATIQTEYSYIDLGEHDIYADGPFKVADKLSFHKLSTGFNIRF